MTELPTVPRINLKFSRILDQIPESELNEYERAVAVLICRIPYGQVASYGSVARWAEHKFGYTKGNARVVANVRMKLYELLGHHSALPLWRVTTGDDERAVKDSTRTRALSVQERVDEGSWDSPVWFEPSKYDDPF